MLKDGGASVTIAGFYREEKIKDLYQCPVFLFAKSYNTRLINRLFNVLKICLCPGQFSKLFKNTDIILARNLEMLMIACWFRLVLRVKTPVFYELLDVHSLLTEKSFKAKIVRLFEYQGLKSVSAVLISSPAYRESHLDKYDGLKIKTILIENKLYPAPKKTTLKIPSNKCKIGWFGIIRCKDSFETLYDLANSFSTRVEIHIAGKPAINQIPDFYEKTKNCPNIFFSGPYKYPEDLNKLYSNVDFCWAIDFYEKNKNSAWLLSNRIYESGYFTVPAIVWKGTQSSQFLESKSLGIHINELNLDYLKNKILNMEECDYNNLRNKYNHTKPNIWSFTKQDCFDLVQTFKNQINGQ